MSTPEQVDAAASGAGSPPSAETLLKLLEIQNSWVRHAEAKALAVLGATAGVVTGGSAVLRTFGQPALSGMVAGALTLLAAALTVGYAVHSLQPRLKPLHGYRSADDTVFFAHLSVAARDAGFDATCERLLDNAVNQDAFARGVARQVVSVSDVAAMKFARAAVAIRWFVMTVPLAVVTILAWSTF